MAKGPELLLKPTHGLLEERRGFLRESAALPVQLRAQPAKRASSARKLLPVPMNGVHKSTQPLLRRTQAVPLRPGCAKLLEAPLHHGFGEFFLAFEVVVDVAYRHASRLGDVRQTRLSETASIRQLRRSLNQSRSLVRLCRSHILRLGGVSYLTNSYHKPDAPMLSTPRHVNLGGWRTNPKGVGSNVSYLAKNSTDARNPDICQHVYLSFGPECSPGHLSIFQPPNPSMSELAILRQLPLPEQRSLCTFVIWAED